jgi:DNA-binding MarR family transcriptional regulator
MATSVTRLHGRAQALEALGQSFRGASRAMRRLRGRDTHRPGALSHAQYQVLFELLPADLAAGELAAVAGVTAASMTQMLDRLADAGLVERLRSEEDRRIVVARLTEAGRKACEERRAAIEPLWREMLADFTASELDTTAAVLDRLTEFFQQLGSEHEEL